MPQYLNPDNPNAGELIVTKVDPVTGIAVQVNPNVTPGFLLPKDAPDMADTPLAPYVDPIKAEKRAERWDEYDDAPSDDVLEAVARVEKTRTVAKSPKNWDEFDDDEVAELKAAKTTVKSTPKTAKAPAKVVKPVEKAGEKTESPAPVATRGVVTTHTPTDHHVDTKSPVFKDKT